MKALRILVVLLSVPIVAAAQIRGRVTDETGHPVEGALVELLSAGARLAITESDSGGAFAFLQPSAVGVALVVRRIGFLPARLQLAGAPRPLVIVLHRRPVRVEGISVTARGGRCVEHDRADARALWEAAAGRYASGVLMPALMAAELDGGGDVPAESLGTFDTTRAVRDTIMGAGRRPLPANRDAFYAEPPLLGMERSYQWDYPRLESVQAWHFADQLFGDLNRLAFAPDLGERVIDFCSSQGDRPYIEGRLYVAPDTTLLKAEWRFITTRPSEDAGGEVVFMPPAPGAPLLASSGHFWRAKASGYYQEWEEFLQWYVCADEKLGCRNRRALGR